MLAIDHAHLAGTWPIISWHACRLRYCVGNERGTFSSRLWGIASRGWLQSGRYACPGSLKHVFSLLLLLYQSLLAEGLSLVPAAHITHHTLMGLQQQEKKSLCWEGVTAGASGTKAARGCDQKTQPKERGGGGGGKQPRPYGWSFSVSWGCNLA